MSLRPRNLLHLLRRSRRPRRRKSLRLRRRRMSRLRRLRRTTLRLRRPVVAEGVAAEEVAANPFAVCEHPDVK
ncbi:MAG: hypothetical protein HYY93_11985 [Planctomycetes bacterium]|nr:hypothetical protein [Planctomycetota bacterium]